MRFILRMESELKPDLNSKGSSEILKFNSLIFWVATHSDRALMSDSVIFFPCANSYTSETSLSGINAVTFIIEYTIDYRIDGICFILL